MIVYTITANLDGYDGPFVIECPSTNGPDGARRRVMWTMIAGGYCEPEGTPDEFLERFQVTGTEEK